MRFVRRPTLLILVAALLAACTRKPQPPPFNPQAEARKFPGIRYRLYGGFSGGEDRITVLPDGKVTSEGKRLGNRSGQASEFQLAQLSRLVEGWEKLDSEYPPPPGSADTFAIEIEYQGRRVTASDANSSVPLQFKQLRSRLETMVRDMKQL